MQTPFYLIAGSLILVIAGMLFLGWALFRFAGWLTGASGNEDGE